jgi:hypothetical protein
MIYLILDMLFFVGMYIVKVGLMYFVRNTFGIITKPMR